MCFGSTFSPFKIDPLSEGSKTRLDRVNLLESVSIFLKLIMFFFFFLTNVSWFVTGVKYSCATKNHWNMFM